MSGVKDLSWVDFDTLDGIEDEFAGILLQAAPDPEAQEVRNKKLCSALKERIEVLREIAVLLGHDIQ